MSSRAEGALGGRSEVGCAGESTRRAWERGDAAGRAVMGSRARLWDKRCWQRTQLAGRARPSACAALLVRHIRRAEHPGRARIWQVVVNVLDGQLVQLLAQQLWHTAPIAALDKRLRRALARNVGKEQRAIGTSGLATLLRHRWITNNRARLSVDQANRER